MFLKGRSIKKDGFRFKSVSAVGKSAPVYLNTYCLFSFRSNRDPKYESYNANIISVVIFSTFILRSQVRDLLKTHHSVLEVIKTL